MIRIVIVRPKIWNVIVIGILPPPLRGEPKPPIACWSPWGHKTIFILPNPPLFVNSRRTSPRAQKKPPLPGEVARRSRDGEVVPSAEAHSRRRQPLSHAPRASSPKRGALKKPPPRELDKFTGSAIIKPQGHHGMRRPGSNECLQDKPRNRHFAEWRFRF